MLTEGAPCAGTEYNQWVEAQRRRTNKNLDVGTQYALDNQRAGLRSAMIEWRAGGETDERQF
jgi:hypothetical protein